MHVAIRSCMTLPAFDIWIRFGGQQGLNNRHLMVFYCSVQSNGHFALHKTCKRGSNEMADK